MERDVVAVVNSHLHFDHCGQNDVFHRRRVPIYVQAAETEMAQTFGYTVPEWAAIPEDALRTVHGDEVLADVVRYRERGYHYPVRVMSTAQAAVYLRKLEDYEARHGRLEGVMRHKAHLFLTWLDEIVRLADPSISHGAPVISGLNGGRAVMRSRVD